MTQVRGLSGLAPHLTTSEMVAAGVVPLITWGGACNRPDLLGAMIRNTGRDEPMFWAAAHGLTFYEVQIHPDTHEREYDWGIDGEQEKRARRLARLRVYEIRPDTPSPVTFMEIMSDAEANRRSIVWFNGPKDFAPVGIGDRKQIANDTELLKRVGPLVHAHLLSYANGMRQLRNEIEPLVMDTQFGPNCIIFVQGDEEAVKAAIAQELNL